MKTELELLVKRRVKEGFNDLPRAIRKYKFRQTFEKKKLSTLDTIRLRPEWL